jgi:hypothetical protein
VGRRARHGQSSLQKARKLRRLAFKSRRSGWAGAYPMARRRRSRVGVTAAATPRLGLELVLLLVQASRGGSNHRAGVGMTTESLARDGRGAALRDRSGHSLTEDQAARLSRRQPKPTSGRGGLLATWRERTEHWLRKTGAAFFAGAKGVTRRPGPRNPTTLGAHGFPTDPTCVLMPPVLDPIPPLGKRAGGKRAPRQARAR